MKSLAGSLMAPTVLGSGACIRGVRVTVGTVVGVLAAN